MNRVDISRLRPICNPKGFEKPIHIIGCGATGSWVATFLAKMGFGNIHLYDFDTIEEHNISNQNYSIEDVGEKKSEILKKYLTKACGCDTIKAYDKRVTKEDSFDGIVFLLTDTMESRKEIFDNCIDLKPQIDLLIETRMGTSSGMIYSIIPTKPYQREKYLKTLYDDGEAEVSACGTPITVLPTATAIASQAVWQFVNFIVGDLKQNEILVDYKHLNLFPAEYNM